MHIPGSSWNPKRIRKAVVPPTKYSPSPIHTVKQFAREMFNLGSRLAKLAIQQDEWFVFLRKECGHPATNVGRRDLAGIDRADGEDNPSSHTANDAANEDHGVIDRASLDTDTDEGDESTDANRPQSAIFVGKI